VRAEPTLPRLTHTSLTPAGAHTDIDDDKGEIAAIERLLIASHNRSARAFVVNILPSQNMSRFAQCRDGTVGCTTRSHMMRLHAAISALALAYHAPLITADCDETPHLFGGDLMHLNQEGHDAVHRRIMGALRKWPYEPLTTLPRSSRHAAAELAVGCWFGAELEQIIGRADGFDRVDFSDARSARSDKIGWQSANASGAELTMCLDLPDPPSGSQRAKPNGKPARLYLASVGLQMSHPKNLPLFGVATISCSGPCTCACFTSEHGRFNTSCMFDGLVPRSSATVTAWARLDIRPKEAAEEAAKKAGGAADSEEQLALPHPEAATCAPQKCALRVRNTADPGETRRRVLVRALILGIRDHYRTKFMNMYHMRHAGMNDARRRLLAVEPAPPQPSLALGTA